jgi:hypothetical protein
MLWEDPAITLSLQSRRECGRRQMWLPKTRTAGLKDPQHHAAIRS